MSAKITQSRQDAEKIPIIQRAGCGPLPESLCPSISPSLHRAFTLIELMVVIGIIGLLIAIVVPAISNARDHAKEVVTLGTIRALETGLETYRADTRLDGDYPPSVFTYAGFYTENPYSTVPLKIPVCGANLLVWAMAGADLLGTPGFRDLDRAPSPPDPFGGWLSDTGPNDLYSIQNGQPVISRSGPFVDVSKMKMSERGTGQYFQIPSARNVVTTPTANLGVLSSYCFLDSFDQPILYYKANPVARNPNPSEPTKPFYMMVDAGNALVSGDYGKYYIDDTVHYRPTGTYNLLDNAPVTGVVDASNNKVVTGMDLGAGALSTGKYHKMAYLGATIVDTTSGKQCMPLDNEYFRGSFTHTVYNPKMITTPRPHNADSFILLSAGKDGIFGSADDIGNFPINKD